MGEGNGGEFDGAFDRSFDGVAIDGVVDAAALSSILEEKAGDSVKGRRTTTSSGVRPPLDAGVGGMNDAAVTGVDDDMAAGLN